MRGIIQYMGKLSSRQMLQEVARVNVVHFTYGEGVARAVLQAEFAGTCPLGTNSPQIAI